MYKKLTAQMYGQLHVTKLKILTKILRILTQKNKLNSNEGVKRKSKNAFWGLEVI